MFTVTLR